MSTSSQQTRTPPPEDQPLEPGVRFRSGLSAEVATVILVALSYFAGTRIGFALTPADAPIAMFWPPNAILLAALLLTPVRLWWPILLAVIPAHFLAQRMSGVPIVTAFGWLLGNAGEALLGAALISRLRRPTTVFHSVDGALRFLMFGFILAPLLTSFLDAAIVVGTRWGQDYGVLWITRLLSNMLAQLTIVPTIVVFVPRALSWIRTGPRRIPVEAVVLAAGVVLVSLSVFRSETLLRTDIPALIYVPLPLLLWASMRFGPGGLSASLLTIAVVSIHSVMHERGPFISTSVAASVLSMQVFLCMIGVPLLLLAAVTMEQRRTEKSLRETSLKLIEAQERERRRIARELHDDVAQTLTLAEIELDQAIGHESGQPPRAYLNKLRDQMTMLSQVIWEIANGLYPSNIEYLGLAHAVRRLCAGLREETSLELHCETNGVPDHLPADISLCLYRVAQEALQNIVSHSKAAHVSIQLRSHEGRLFLRIVDDGVGFNQSLVAAGLGFASMRQRLTAVDGGVEIDSAPGRGTRLDAWVVLPDQPSGLDAKPTIQ